MLAPTPIPPKERLLMVMGLDVFPAFAWEDQKQPIPTMAKVPGVSMPRAKGKAQIP